ncbi:MAG: hypothetical protein ACI8TX_001242 [Hyphomicrobiaceae bacterium]|jgi:hypothetical protein
MRPGSPLISEETRQRLRYVKADDPRLSLDRFPDFFIVGPQRTGTTWLHANLRWHPEIFMAEPKEIFFFNRLSERKHPKFVTNDLGWYLRFFRPSPALWVYEHLMALQHHGRIYRPRVRGEASASYAAMSDELIAELAVLGPKSRILMMVRDPVERAWSHAKKDLVRNRDRKMEDVSDAEWQAFFSDPYQLRCAHASRMLEHWRAHFPAQQVLAARYNDVSERPESLLTETMTFLGVSSGPRYIGALARETVNPTPESRIPEKHRAFLEEILDDAVQDWKNNWAPSSETT